MKNHVDLYGMFEARTKNVRKDPFMTAYRIEQIIRQADRSLQAAMSYVWGAEDYGHQVVTEVYGRRIDSASWEFGYMYGLMHFLYLTDQLYSMPCIRDAFVAFRASRDLREYVHEGK